MPMYDIVCPNCGQVEDAFATLKEIEAEGIRCPGCHALSSRRITVNPNSIVGVWTDKPIHSKQLGVSFTSSQQMEKYCAARGLEPVSPKGSTWGKIAQKSREKHDAQIKEEGFSSREEKKKHWSDQKAERVKDATKRAAKGPAESDNVRTEVVKL